MRPSHFSRRSRRLRWGLSLTLPNDPALAVAVGVGKPELKRGGVVMAALPPRGDGPGGDGPVRTLGDSIVDDLNGPLIIMIDQSDPREAAVCSERTATDLDRREFHKALSLEVIQRLNCPSPIDLWRPSKVKSPSNPVR
mmetsp:Transcript_9724/g.27262  ORF Transcript_9724/g.27262 Transcript_9724/m.27262 type:complete len:139 (+) Transcript_9724:394-810(+)